jgi:aspartate/methionine/tyrosine aminotransferase
MSAKFTLSIGKLTHQQIMKYRRMPIEMESPEELGYENVRCNLAESSVTDATFKDLGIQLNDLVLAYGDHRGNKKLRELIAAKYPGISADDVLITAGAAAALFIVATSLLEKDDHLIVQFPNYATNLATPEMIGCAISKIELKFEENFNAGLEKYIQAITPATKLISITHPHNPTGVVISANKLAQLIRVAEDNKCFLLVDETYRDLCLDGNSKLAASKSENAISISSISKAYGLPGLRIGWIVTKNKILQETFLAAKEQIFICNSGIDEEIAFRFLNSNAERKMQIDKQIRNNFAIVDQWMQENPFLEWIKPTGGVVCFPRFKSNINIDIKRFYETLNNNYKTFVGPGHWFGMPDNYMRIGYGWPNESELKEGLQNILQAAKESS